MGLSHVVCAEGMGLYGGIAGRLWELMRLGEPHLAELSELSFLVLDEADRMVQQGHYQVTVYSHAPWSLHRDTPTLAALFVGL